MDHSQLVRLAPLRELAARRLAPVSRGSLTMTPATGGVTYQGHAVILTPSEFMVLHCIGSQSIASREQIAALLDVDGSEFSGRPIDGHIRFIRRKLYAASPWKGDIADNGPIANLRDRGWVWLEVAADSEAPPSPEAEEEPPVLIDGLSELETRIVLLARQGVIHMHIARELKVPLPRVSGILVKARALGISTHPE